MHSSPGGSSPAPRAGRDSRPTPVLDSVGPGTLRTKVVFFDAEGTLWIERPGRRMDEFWQSPTRTRAREVFQAAHGVRAVLRALRASGCLLVVLSRHDERVLPEILEEFRLSDLFDDVLINGDKGERALGWLQGHEIQREEALMVGDREDLDIRPMRRVGIRSLLVDRPYNREVEAERIFTLRELPGRLLPREHDNPYNRWIRFRIS